MSRTKFANFREKPKHRVRTVIISSLIVVAMVASVVFGIGFFKTSEFVPLEDLGYETVKYEVPLDGSTPDEHTALEAVGYMHYTLSNQTNWYSEMHGTVSTIISQEIATYKQFSNGVLISSDITTSSMIANAFQFCTTDETVLWRAAAGGKETYNGKDTAWSTDAPKGLSIKDYKTQRGLPPSAFSVYIINEHTLLEEGTTSPVRNEDGTYSITANLSIDSDGETAAVYYYKQQMAVTGGLSSHPTFNYINVKYTFDSNYRILKTEIDESYQATMGVSVTCNATSTTEYNYESGWENTAYEDYFSNYTDSFTQGDAGTQITAVGCLSSAFGSVLVDGGTFAVDLGINGETHSGIVDVGLKDGGISSLSAQIGNLDVRLVNDGKNYIYVSYGEGTKLSLCIDDLDLSSLSGGVSLDTSSLLEQLGGGTFTINEAGTVATLDCNLSLMGLELPLSFVFNIAENGAITLGNVKADISINGEPLTAALAFTDRTNAPAALTEAEKATYTAFDGANLSSLIKSLSSEVIELNIGLETSGFAVSGSISLNLSELAVNANVTLTVNGKTSNIAVAYKDDIVYLTLGGTSKIKTSLSHAIELISLFLTTGSTDVPTEPNESPDLTPVKTLIGGGINAIATAEETASSGINIMNIVYTLLFDSTFTENLGISDDGDITFNADGLLKGVGVDMSSVLGSDFTLGTFTAKIDDGNLSFNSPVLNVTVSEGSTFEIPEEDYVEVDFVDISEYINQILSAGELSLVGTINLTVGETVIPITLNQLSLSWHDGISLYLNANLTLGDKSHRLVVSYNESGAAVVYDQLGINLTATDLTTLGNTISSIISSVDGVDINIDLSSIENLLSTLTSSTSSSSVDISSILGLLGGLDITVTEDGGYLLKLDGIGDITISTADGLKLGADIAVSGIEADASLALVEYTAGTLPTDLMYLSGEVVNKLLTEVETIINEGKLRIGVTGEETLTIIAGATVVKLSDVIFELSFKNGIGFALNASLELDGFKHDLYASYYGDTLKFSYATFGAELKIGGENNDIDKLKLALVQLFNRVGKIIDTMTSSNTPSTQVATFDELINLIETLDATKAIAGVLHNLTSLIPSNSAETDTLSMVIGLLNKATITSSTTGISLTLGELSLGLNYAPSETANFNLSLTYETNDFKIVATKVEFGALTATNGAYERIENYLTVDDFIEMLDYVGATVDMFAESSFTLGITGKVYSSESKFDAVDGVRYLIDARLEFEWGENGYPAHLEVPGVNDNTDWNFYLDSTMYAHIGVNVYAQHESDSSYKIDLYILDANPTNSNGITTSATTTTDGELDVYVSVSVIPGGAANESITDPLLIYLPASDLMTIVAAGAAMLDIGSLGINTEGMDGIGLEAVNLVNSVIGSLATGIDSLIVDKYLTNTREQFESLGSSLISQILGGSLSDMLNNMLGSILGGNSSSSSDIVLTSALPTTEVPGGFIKEVSFDENKNAKIVLNSEYIYGSSSFKDIEFTASKITVENEDGTTHTLLKKADITNIYYNSNNKYSVDIGIQMSYDSIRRKTNFSGFYNFSEIDSLITTLVNSATHAVAKEDGTTGYDLNRNFYLSGSVSLALWIYEVNVNIEGISITLDENNKISANARLSYEPDWLRAAIKNAATVDISIIDDMIFIKKTVSGASTYRAMTLTDFLGDIMNQLIYMLSLTDLIASQMTGSNGNNTSTAASKDIGATVKELLKSFTSSTSGDSKSWTLNLNGDGIAALAPGLTISDIPVTIKAQKSDDGGYIATNLDLDGKLFGAINFDLSLAYGNPQSKTVNDVTIDVSDDTLTTVNGEAITLAKVLGGTSSEAIRNTVDWDQILRDSGNSYLEYSSNSSVKIGTYSFECMTDLSGGTHQFDDTYLALYNSNGTLYTRFTELDISDDIMPVIEGQERVWADPIIDGNNVVLRKIYALAYDVTVNSAHQTDYTPVANENDGTIFTTIYKDRYESILLPIGILADEEDGMYILTGYRYLGSGNAVDSLGTSVDKYGNTCIVMPVTQDTTVEAVWARAYALTLTETDAENNTSHQVIYYATGTTLTLADIPAPTERKGHSASWLYNGVAMTSETTITLTEDTELTAEYIASIHTVTISSKLPVDGFVANDSGVYVWQQSFTYGDTLTLPTYQDLEYYTFGGYNYDTAEGGKLTSFEFAVESDLSLKLNWEARPVYLYVTSSISYKYAGLPKTDGENMEIKISDGVYTLGEPTADGYTFLGWWSKNADGTFSQFTTTDLSSYASSTATTNCVYLYTLWMEVNSSVTGSRATNWDFTNRSYTANGTISLALYGDADLVSSASISANYVFTAGHSTETKEIANDSLSFSLTNGISNTLTPSNTKKLRSVSAYDTITFTSTLNVTINSTTKTVVETATYSL